MNNARRDEYLGFFSSVATVYQNRFADPLWSRHPNVTTSIIESLGVFLEGYAFERQGRPEDFSHVAADIITALGPLPLSPHDLWRQFRSKLGAGGLNIKNNPLAPKDTPFTDKNRRACQTRKYSVIEVANSLAVPLVQWIRCALREDRTDEVYAKISGITGVSDKIASFFLRDVAWRYGVFPSTSRWKLQPIDIWVRRSAPLLGMTGNDKATAEWIVEVCSTVGGKPEEVNQGLWYFGSEIAGSQYRLKQALTDLDKAKSLFHAHLDSLRRAASTIAAVAAT